MEPAGFIYIMLENEPRYETNWLLNICHAKSKQKGVGKQRKYSLKPRRTITRSGGILVSELVSLLGIFHHCDHS